MSFSINAFMLYLLTVMTKVSPRNPEPLKAIRGARVLVSGCLRCDPLIIENDLAFVIASDGLRHLRSNRTVVDDPGVLLDLTLPRGGDQSDLTFDSEYCDVLHCYCFHGVAPKG